MKDIYIKTNSLLERKAADAALLKLGFIITHSVSDDWDCYPTVQVSRQYFWHCVAVGRKFTTIENEKGVPLTAALRMIEEERKNEAGINCRHIFTPLFPCHIVTVSEEDRAAHIAALEAAGIKLDDWPPGREKTMKFIHVYPIGYDDRKYMSMCCHNHDGFYPAVTLEEAIRRIEASRKCDHVCAVHPAKEG